MQIYKICIDLNFLICNIFKYVLCKIFPSQNET